MSRAMVLPRAPGVTDCALNDLGFWSTSDDEVPGRGPIDGKQVRESLRQTTSRPLSRARARERTGERISLCRGK